MSECLPPGFTHSAIDSIPSGLTDIALSCSFSPLLSALAVHIVGVNRSINGVLLRSVNGDSSSTSASKTLDCNDDNDYVEEDSNNDNVLYTLFVPVQTAEDIRWNGMSLTLNGAMDILGEFSNSVIKKQRTL